MTSRPMRLFLIAAVTATLLTGLQTTAAYWTDQHSSTGFTIQSSNLDLTVGPSAAQQHLSGTADATWTSPGMSFSTLFPGESLATTIVITNAGGTAMDANAVISVSSGALSSGANGLHLTIYDNSSAGATSGSLAAMNRQTTCTGGTQIASIYPTTTEVTIWPSNIELAVGANRSLCIRAQLPATAPQSLQHASTTINLRFHAQQRPA